MTRLPESGLGEELEAGSPLGLPFWARARSLVGGRMTYALGDQVVYSFGNMVVAALLSRHAAARDFGIYILTQRTLDLCIQFCNVFSWGPFTFNLPGMASDRQRLYIGSMVVQQIAGCLLSSLVLLAARGWSAGSSRGIYYAVFAPLVLTSIGILFREFTRRMYFAEMRFQEAFWTDVATVALQLAGVEWLFRVHRLTVPSTLQALSAGAILVSLWWVLREWRTFTVGWRENLDDMRLNLHLGRWFLGSNMVFMASSQCNPWVLSALLGGASVGAYAVCESVVNIPRVALTSMQNMMAPMMARAFTAGGKPALRRMVSQLNGFLFGGSTLFALAIFWIGPWVSRLIFHASPPNARLILVLLAVNFVASAATIAQNYGLTVIDKADTTFYAQLAGLVVQFSVAIWLVRMLHVPGAALAMLLGSLVVIVVRQLYYAREMRRA